MATPAAVAGSPGRPNPDDLPPRALPCPPAVDPLEGHRLHLRALIRQERSAAYQRVDYLSNEWQMGLWREEVEGAHNPMAPQVQESCRSPSSVTSPTFSFGGGPEFNHGANANHGANHGGNGNRGGGRGHPNRANSHPAPSKIRARWREKIVEWKYRVVDRFNLDREIVSISTFYLDRYLSMKYVDEELFRLVAMASLYLAMKIHSSRNLSIHSIVGTGNGLIHARHIEAMELIIMKGLDWRLTPPTAAGFVENFYPLLAARCGAAGGSAGGRGGERAKLDESLELSRFLSELSVCAYPFVSAAPSSVALAAVLYSLEYVGLLRETSVRGHCAGLAAELGLDVEGREVHACGELLRKVHRLAVPGSSLRTTGPTGSASSFS